MLGIVNDAAVTSLALDYRNRRLSLDTDRSMHRRVSKKANVILILRVSARKPPCIKYATPCASNMCIKNATPLCQYATPPRASIICIEHDTVCQ